MRVRTAALASGAGLITAVQVHRRGAALSQAAAGQQPALPGDEEVPVPPLRVLADGDGAKKPVLGDALCQDIQFRQVEIPAGLVGAGEDAPYWK